MDADLGVGSSAALFPFDFQTAVSTASEDVAAECAGGEEQKPKIALTFDDGPNIKYTPMLLDGLKERGIKATFFLIGANTEQEESKKIVKRMYEEGHLIGNHTYRHVDLSKISGREAEKRLKLQMRRLKRSQDMRRNLSVRRLGQCRKEKKIPIKYM